MKKLKIFTILVSLFSTSLMSSCKINNSETVALIPSNPNDISENSSVKEIYSEVVEVSQNKSKLRVYVVFSANVKNIKLPAELHYNGIVLSDDGNGNDKVKGDLIYTSYADVIESTSDFKKGTKRFYVYENNKLDLNKARKLPNKNFYIDDNQDMFWYFKCSVDVVAVGSKCFGETCPNKSYFGGQTWFCICTKDCEFCIGDCKK